MIKSFWNKHPGVPLFPGYLLILLFILLDRFDWPDLLAIAITGLVMVIIAEIIARISKAEISKYLVKALISLVLSVVVWFVANEAARGICEKVWGWGWWLTKEGEVVENTILFAPAAITSIFWAVYVKKGVNKILMILINPVTHLSIWWYIVDYRLACLPT